MHENDKTIFDHHSLVTTVDDLLEHVHSTENGHVGNKKTLAEVWKYSELCMLSYSQASQKINSH